MIRIVDAVADGSASGAFRADLDPELAAEALAGALFHRRLLTGRPLAPDRVPELLDAVLGAPTQER